MLTQQQVADHIEITEVLQRYFRAIDEKDYGLLDRVFTRDALVHYEMGRGREMPFREMLPRIREFNRSFRVMHHIPGLPAIEIEADAAHSTLNLRAVHVQQCTDGSDNTWVVYGVYRDVLIRSDAGWRISRRHFVSTITEGEALPADQVTLFERPPWLGRR